MRHPERWTPSKFVTRRGRWRASKDSRELGVGSRLIADAVVQRYDSYLPRFARGRLIDLGCGKVPLYGAYRSLVSEVTCVDWAQSPHPSIHLDHELDLSQALPFADAAFDTIILSDVLEHVPSPQNLWNDMARLLAPGGHVLLNVPFLYGIHEAPHDYGRYTEFALRRFARDAGLEVPLLVSVGGSVHVLADMLSKHLDHLPLLGRPLAIALQALVALTDRWAWGQRLAEFSGAHYPLGYFVVARRPLAPGGAGPG
ncbi:MAG TPA: class I SAM-dependent methyltransferase [Rhizobacter sp.]|nr:class I SAM-dependent methyltransferase [Rhizobacter sp.]